MSRVVAALGGNALLLRGEEPTSEAQQRNLIVAGRAIAPIAKDHELVVTHGTGPQVGLLAMRAEEATGSWREPLDVIGAETDGMIGYLLARELGNQLPERSVVTILTQVEVDADDPAFGEPTKPIGPVLPKDAADALVRARGWTVTEEAGGWRRVVPSPEPRRIVEVASARILIDAGHLVVCAGGGGVPVRRSADGSMEGAEVVVDKDLTAALLATELGADILLLLTDAVGVYRDWPSTDDVIRRATPREIRSLPLSAGSMGPKAEAAARFAEQTGGRAIIGAMHDAQKMLTGQAGTVVAR